MDLLNELAVRITEAQLGAFGMEGEVDGEGEEVDDEVTEIEEGVFVAQGEEKKKRAGNYSEVEDVLLVRAWSEVGMCRYALGMWLHC